MLRSDIWLKYAFNPIIFWCQLNTQLRSHCSIVNRIASEDCIVIHIADNNKTLGTSTKTRLNSINRRHFFATLSYAIVNSLPQLYRFLKRPSTVSTEK
ncbi:unnamed protein product [Heterobilharzia americana]|nr:unnamed protein product [Heterobilharzia americana]